MIANETFSSFAGSEWNFLCLAFVVVLMCCEARLSPISSFGRKLSARLCLSRISPNNSLENYDLWRRILARNSGLTTRELGCAKRGGEIETIIGTTSSRKSFPQIFCLLWQNGGENEC